MDHTLDFAGKRRGENAACSGPGEKRRPYPRKDSDGPFFGAHLSIEGGVHRSAERAFSLGCRAFQLFTKNSNQWRGKEIPDEDAREFRTRVHGGSFSHIVAHDSYLINVASPDTSLRKKSVTALADEMRRADLLGLDYLVMHPGAHKGAGIEEGLKRVADSLAWVLDRQSGDVAILLETTAGQGSSLGSRFEELRWVIDAIGKGDRIGVCLDTAHIFAAGYDIRDRESYERTIEEFDQAVGLERLNLIHINDTLKELGSHVDRHHHIGKGRIGREGFRLIVTDKRFQRLPMIIETPKGEDDRLDRRNLSVLRKLAREG